MALPYPGLDFVPFDVLTAEELDKMVANDEALADGTGFDDGAIPVSKMDLTTADKTTLTFSASYNTNSWGLLQKFGDWVFVNIRWQKNTGNFTSGENTSISIPSGFRLSYTSPDSMQITGLRDPTTLGRLIVTGPTNSTANSFLLFNGVGTGHNYLDMQGVYSLVKS